MMQLPLPFYVPSLPKQVELFDQKQPDFHRIEKFFHNINPIDVDRYLNYWQGLAPKTEGESLLRWLFAFMSVHTSWKANVTGYQALKDLKWTRDKNDLLNTLQKSRVGLHNQRTRFIWKFYQDFKKNAETFVSAPDCWKTLRDSLTETVLGLGIAKISFSLEMSHPSSCEVVCMDTHMFQVYGLDQTKDRKMYKLIESHWKNLCRAHKIPCYIARCLYWDGVQGKQDSRYWSYVFE